MLAIHELEKASLMVPAGNALGVLSNPQQAAHIQGAVVFRGRGNVVCRVSEKPLQRSRWNFLERHQLLMDS